MYETVVRVREIAVPGQRLCGLTWMDGLLWFSDAGLQQILAVDPAGGGIVSRIACAGVRTDLTHLNGRLIQIAGPARRLRIIDPASGQVEHEWPNPRPGTELCGLEGHGDVVWMGFREPAILDCRRSADLSLIDTTPAVQNVAGLTIAGEYVAFANYAEARINLFDPETKQIVSHLSVPGNPTGLTWDGERLWYCDYTNVRLCAVDGPGRVH